jgi:two-component system response regulator AtoC
VPSARESRSVLVVDDDASVGAVLAALLRQDGMDAEVVGSGAEALGRLDARPFDAVVTDLRMDGMDGMELLGRVHEKWPDLPVVMMSAHGTVPLAVEAMKRGATDFVMKPFEREEILYVLEKALAGASVTDGAPPAPPVTGGLVYRSRAMAEALELVDRVATSAATVLILGETGTGKELVARAVHDRSPRRSEPFIKLHCAALPETLLESELFGYEKGAFTGAVTRKPGRVELAHGGTLFLDEIGDISAATQVKLLRLLQAREFERLGGTQTVTADVRFVAATHRDLAAMVGKGEFREDLYYRLNVVPIWLPPLRERSEDVAVLARHFCASYAKAAGRGNATFADDALALLGAQPWPGNVRQLGNFVERLVLLSDATAIGASDVRRELARGPRGVATAPDAPGSNASGPAETQDAGELAVRTRSAERDAIVSALTRTGGSRTQAARLLGISRRALYYKLEEHHIQD